MLAAPAPSRRRLALGAALLATAACSRDLALPAPSTLALGDAFPTAAPWEQRVIDATGGTRPYTFAFAPGGNGSGGTVDPATGDYVAGATGPAVDVIDVRDASGAVRTARISVGPPLQVAATSAFVAPGGLATFIATGGKAPYLLEVVGGPAPGTIVGTTFEAAPSGGCGGAVSSPATVALRLSDATAAPAVDLAVTVGRGLDLFPAAGSGSVAPYEQIAFVSSGGQPPYQFSLRDAQSLGAAIDVGRGTYAAGSTGNVVDVVQVTDANGEEQCFPVDVGPALGVSLSSLDPRPGKPMRLLATGGRPPYTFAFALKGNRSRGTIETVTGEYVPGLNALATDLLQVSDATTAPPVGPIAVKVGPLEVVTGDGNWGCATGPIDGDSTPDALVYGFMGSLKTILSSSTGGLPKVAEYPLQLQSQPAALDLDGDGDLDVVYLAGNGLETLLAEPGGQYIAGPRVASVQGTLSSLLAAGPGGRVFVGTSYDPTCNPGGGVALVAFDYDAAAGDFGPVKCIAGVRPVGYLGMASGDFDGDGIADVAYGASSNGTPWPSYVFWRLSHDVPAYSVEYAAPLPGTWLARRFNTQVVNPWLAVHPSGPYADLVVVTTDAPASAGVFNTGLAVFAGGPTGLTFKQVRTTTPGGYNLMSVSPIGMDGVGTPQLVAANVTNGTMEFLDYAVGAASPLSTAALQLSERPFRVGSVCSADFDADGQLDMVVAPRNGIGASAELLLGDAGGTYAQRPRFATANVPTWSGDVDGDGLPDLVEPTVGGGVEVLFSSGGQLALGPETPVDGQYLSSMVADWSGDGVPDLMVRSGATSVSLYPGLPAHDGHFAAPQPVTVTDPAGLPASYAASFALTGRFGGTSSGLDLVGIERVGSSFQYVALIFQDGTHAVAARAPGAIYYAPLVFDADGDGIDDVAEVGGFGTILSLVKPGDPKGTYWPFRPWANASTGEVWLAAGVVPVPAPDPSPGSFPRARGVYVGPSGFTLVEAPGGSVGAIGVAVDPALLSDAIDAHVVRVDSDPWPDLVVARSRDWIVFPGTADGSFEATPRADLTFSPGWTLNMVPLFLPWRGESGLDDLLVNSTQSNVVVLHNDGAGHFD